MSTDNGNNIKRRVFLQGTSLVAGALAFKPLRSQATEIEAQDFASGPRELVAYPQKSPLMRITPRPPHLETPFSVFNDSVLTPNDAFLCATTSPIFLPQLTPTAISYGSKG